MKADPSSSSVIMYAQQRDSVTNLYTKRQVLEDGVHTQPIMKTFYCGPPKTVNQQPTTNQNNQQVVSDDTHPSVREIEEMERASESMGIDMDEIAAMMEVDF